MRAGTIARSRQSTGLTSTFSKTRWSRRANIVITASTMSRTAVSSCSSPATQEAGRAGCRWVSRCTCARPGTMRRSSSSTRSRLGRAACRTRCATRITRWTCSMRRGICERSPVRLSTCCRPMLKKPMPFRSQLGGARTHRP